MHGSRGKRHDYLGMWIDYSILGEVRISMEEYLRGVLDDFPEDTTETPKTPSASNLFNVRDDNERELLNETRAQAFTTQWRNYYSPEPNSVSTHRQK